MYVLYTGLSWPRNQYDEPMISLEFFGRASYTYAPAHELTTTHLP